MKRILLIIFLFISLGIEAQQLFSGAGIKIGSENTYNWRIYRSGSGSTNQSLLFASVGGTANAETIRARFTHWGGLSLGGVNINSTDLLSVNGNTRIAGNINLPLLSNQSGVISLKGEASDIAHILAEQYGSGSGSRLKFQIGDDMDDYFSFVHNHHSSGVKEIFKFTRDKADLDGDLQSSKMGHFKGWTSGGLTGLGLDMGIVNGIGHVLTYDRTNAQYHDMRITARGGANKGLYLSTNGNIGFDDDTPEAKLTVQGGDIQTSHMGHFKGWTSGGLTGLGLDMGIVNGIGHVLTYDRTNAQYHDMRITARGGVNKGIYISTNGNFGIDDDSPDHKLSVNGMVRSKEVMCDNDNWPDYVFTDSYELRSLDEVSAFIKANGHLPNIPSAQEVASNGIKLSEMSASLLEKVEELTLYTISQEEQIKDQNEKLASQNQQITTQQDALKKQEALIQTLIERIENLEK